MLTRNVKRSFEALETKRLMTCDVSFDGTDLNINCDEAGDFILIRQESGDLIVGLDNLGSAANLEDVKIKSGGGDDAIIIDGLDVAGDLKIKSGDGDDVVTLIGLAIGDDAKIRTQGGDDNVFFQGATTVGDDLNVRTGSGNDQVFALFGAAIAGDDIRLNGGSGDEDSLVGEANFTAGDDLKIKGFE